MENNTDMHWSVQNQSLRFTLGELCPAQAKFRGFTNSSAEFLFHSETLTEGTVAEFLRSEADALVVRAYPAPSRLPLLSRTDNGLLRYAPIRYDRCFITFDGDYEEYLAKFSSKSRKNLKRSIRDFANLCGGTLDVRGYRSREEMLQFHRIARAISERTYQEQVVQQGLPADDSFVAGMLDLADKGRNRGYLLFCQEKPVAFAYCSADGEGLYYDHVGYEPEFAKWSPGSILLLSLVERLFDERQFRWLDFGESEDPYKVFYSNRRMPCSRVYFFRPTVKCWRAVLLHVMWMGITGGVGELLRRTNLHKRVKLLLRRFAGMFYGVRTSAGKDVGSIA